MTKDILVIGDPHARSDYSNERFDWLGQLICDLKVDLVVNIGDHFCLPSLSSYDKGKKTMEGKRVSLDIDAGIEANDRIWSPIRKTKRKQPGRLITLGNHENRLNRAIEDNAQLEGILSLDDLELKEFGYEVYPFLEPVTVEGISFSHYFQSGILGRAVGGQHPGYSLNMTQLNSCVAGHNHLLSFDRRVSVDGRTTQSLSVGCFFDYDAEYAGKMVNKMYWRGLCLLKNVSNGDYDLETISMDRLKKVYGGK